MRCVTLTNSRAQVAMSEGYECNALRRSWFCSIFSKTAPDPWGHLSGGLGCTRWCGDLHFGVEGATHTCPLVVWHSALFLLGLGCFSFIF